MLDILTVGAALHDVFLFSDEFKLIKDQRFEGGVAECVPLGAKITLEKIVHSTGGGAANASVTFSRLGLKTGILCRLGEDASGDTVLRALKDEGVNTHTVRRIKKGETGYSTLLTASNGERTVLAYRGVSAGFEKKDIPPSIRARAVYLTSLGGHLERSRDVIRAATKEKAIIFWNPGHKELEAGRIALMKAAKDVHVLNMNREEGALLAGSRDLEDIFNALRRPEAITIITDGPKGTYAETPHHRWHAGTTDVVSVSRTGAGDAFGSGFAAGLLAIGDVPTALKIGTANAEQVIQHIGATKGILRTFPTKAVLQKISVTELA